MNKPNRMNKTKALNRKFYLLYILNFFLFSVFIIDYLSAQSVFSFREEGASVLAGDAHSAALGYSEIPTSFSSNICGSMSFLQRTGIDVTYDLTRLEMRTAESNNIKYYYNISSIKAGSRLPLGLAFGFYLKKAMDFNADFLTDPDSVNGVVYQERFFKRGQLSNGNVELSKRLTKGLGVGIGFNVLFGSSDEVWITNFSDTSYKDTEDSLNSSYLGYSYNLGFVYKQRFLSFALGYNFPVSLSKVKKSFSQYRKDTTLANDELTFPSSYTLGLGLTPLETWNFFATIRYRDWSSLKYNGVREEKYKSVFSYSIGIEYSGAAGYKKRVFPLRVGYYKHPWYFNDASNESIQDDGITLGTNIPILRRGGNLDIAVILGRRRTRTIEERFYHLALGFNFYERW